MIIADTTPKEQAFEDLDLLWKQNVRNSFYFFSDELKQTSRKIIHQQGVVGKVRWHDRGGHDYTGILNGGF